MRCIAGSVLVYIQSMMMAKRSRSWSYSSGVSMAATSVSRHSADSRTARGIWLSMISSR
jgi:hypothetical protein